MAIEGVSGEDCSGGTPRGVLVGHLSDREVASRMVALLSKEGIAGPDIFFDAGHKRYILTIARGEDLPRALNIYRHSLGLPPLREAPEQISAPLPLGKVTIALMVLSTLTWLLFQFGLAPALINLLYISVESGRGLPEVARGEFWRLVTPMFLHFHFLHIVFNMMCLMQFGTIQEKLLGRGGFIAFVLMASLLSNIFQYWESGPNYGGMSGVIFAQLGFLWCYKKCEPTFPHGLSRDVVVAAGIWFLLCLTGIFFFKMANVAHGVGLAAGIVMAPLWSAWQGKRPPLLLPLGVAGGIVALTYGAGYWL